MRLIIVSGLSGSGKSVTLHALEDMGYYCVDNLPVSLLQTFAMQMMQPDGHGIENAAIGMDARNRPEDLPHMLATCCALKAQDFPCEILFLQAQDAVLIQRFSETRRKHPLTRPDLPLAEAILSERRLLAPLAAHADLLIDTTRTNVHQLRQLVQDRMERRVGHQLVLLFESFGYKHGVPADADFVFDLRCLPNPHWEPALRALSGLDPGVVEFLHGQADVERMVEELTVFLESWIACFEAEHRSYLTVALGCTGGQHRSVYISERLAQHFRTERDSVLVRHRDLL